MIIDEAVQLVSNMLRQVREVRDVGIINLRRQGLDSTQAHADMTIRKLFEAMLLIEREPSIASYIFCDCQLKLEDTAEITLELVGDILIHATTDLILRDTLTIPNTLSPESVIHLLLQDTSHITLEQFTELRVLAQTLLKLEETLDIPNALLIMGLLLKDRAELTLDDFEWLNATAVELLSIEDGAWRLPRNYKDTLTTLRDAAEIWFSPIDIKQESTLMGLTDTATLILTPV